MEGDSPLLLLPAGSYPSPCSAGSSSGGPGLQLPGEEEIKWQVHCWLWILLLQDHPCARGRTSDSEESVTTPSSLRREIGDSYTSLIFLKLHILPDSGVCFTCKFKPKSESCHSTSSHFTCHASISVSFSEHHQTYCGKTEWVDPRRSLSRRMGVEELLASSTEMC